MLDTRTIVTHTTLCYEFDAKIVQQIAELAARKMIHNFKVTVNSLVEQKTQIRTFKTTNLAGKKVVS